MPELPDIVAYLAALNRQLQGKSLLGVTVRSPFLLRTFEPEIAEAAGRTVVEFSRIGKRIVIELDPPLYLVIHLMRAGRFHWRKAGTKPKSKADLAAFEFDFGTLMLTEAGTKKRASLHVLRPEAVSSTYW